MAASACFVCSTVSPGSLPALETICMPSGKSIAEQLCRGLDGCLLPLMPEHVACISCQQTVSHLDQLWVETEALQRALSDKFTKAFQLVNLSTITLEDNARTSEADIGFVTNQMPPLAEAIDDPSPISLKPADKDPYDIPENIHSSPLGSPCCITVEPQPCPQNDTDIDSTMASSQSPAGAVQSEAGQSKSALATPQVDISATESTVMDPTHPDSANTVPASAPHTSGRAPRSGPKKCPHCGRVYQRWRDLDTHLSVHTGSLPHQCPECGRQFASRRRLADHQRGHAEGWSCHLCDKVFRHSSSLQHHRRQHERPSPASVCPICCRTLSGAAQLRAHLRTHTDERPYQCDACPRTFSRASTLRVHARLHSGERPFQCDTCGKAFRGRAAFMTHLQQHGAVAARFACDMCDKTFFYKSKMEQHRATHRGRQTACCEQCGLTFSSVAALRRHHVTHSTHRPHVCSTCGRRFKEAGVLKKHQRQMHATDAAHVCSECGKRCAGPFKLNEHMRTHTGERPFACEQCPKSFTQAVHLSMHRRTHQRTEATAEFATV